MHTRTFLLIFPEVARCVLNVENQQLVPFDFVKNRMPESTYMATAHAVHFCFLRGIRMHHEYLYCLLNTIRKIGCHCRNVLKQI